MNESRLNAEDRLLLLASTKAARSSKYLNLCLLLEVDALKALYFEAVGLMQRGQAVATRQRVIPRSIGLYEQDWEDSRALCDRLEAAGYLGVTPSTLGRVGLHVLLDMLNAELGDDKALPAAVETVIANIRNLLPDDQRRLREAMRSAL